VEQLLSQEEIDALLKGISEGDVDITKEAEASEAEADVSATVLDFAKYTRSRKDKFSALDFISDRLSKSLRSALSIFLEREVEVNLNPIQYIPYSEFIKTLPLPTNMNIIMTDNLKGFFIVIFDAKLIFCVLETMFGSTSVTAPKIEGREFTKIEFNVIKKLIDVVCVETEKAWEPVYEVKCKYSRSEINPNYITMVSPEETVVLLEYSIEIADVVSWMKICMPYSILETIKGYLVSTPSREDMDMREKWLQRLRLRVKDVPLEVRAILGKKRVPVEEFLKIKEGSIIVTETGVDEAIDLQVANRTKIKGKMGVFKGSMAVKVEQIVD
jgi:flagellar motor switch protein FliM